MLADAQRTATIIDAHALLIKTIFFQRTEEIRARLLEGSAAPQIAAQGRVRLGLLELSFHLFDGKFPDRL